MKKLSIILAAVSLIMALALCVGAAETIYDGGSNNSVKLTAENAPTGVAIQWSTWDTDIISLGNDGTVTAVKPGDATVTARYLDEEVEQTETFDIVVAKYGVESIEASLGSSNFAAGTTIQKSDITVTATYTDGTTDKNYTNFTFSPNEELKTTDKTLTVTSNDNASAVDELDITVTELSIEDLVTAISASVAKTEYTVGDKITTDDISVTVTYVGNKKATATVKELGATISGLTFSDGSHTFSKDEKGSITLTVGYAGFGSAVTIKVTESTSTTKPTVTLTPTTSTDDSKVYYVGDTFDCNGYTIVITLGDNKVTYTASEFASKIDYTFKDSDVGANKTKSFSFNETIDGTVYTVTVKFSGLTIESKSSLEVYSIVSVVLKESKYPVNYKFTLDDISFFTYRETRKATSTKKVYGENLANYTNTFDLEVLDEDGDTKRTTKMYYLEESDVCEDDDGDSYVNMMFTVDDEEFEFEVNVGNTGVTLTYKSDTYETYDELDEALEDIEDNDVEDLDLEEDVVASKYILLTLGEAQTVSSIQTLDPVCNVVIDLAGNELSMYRDTIDISTANKNYAVTLKNSSSTAAKITYRDEKDITVTLEKGESITIQYGDDGIPGTYTVTSTADSNGKITLKGSTTAVETTTVGKGSDITFTITPNSGYEIDTLYVDSSKKTASTATGADYTIDNNGVGTYTLKDVSKDITVKVTFKKTTTTTEETKTETEWQNPFTDVKTTDSYYNAVKFLYQNGITTGMSATKFGSTETLTRAQFVTFLGRLAGYTDAQMKTLYGTRSSFTDVSSSEADIAYAVPYIAWASEKGLIEGYGNGKFGPRDNITNQQMYLIMMRYALKIQNCANNAGQVTLTATDKGEIASWAQEGILFAAANNLLVSTYKIAPTADAARWQMAVVLYNFYNNILLADTGK